MPEDVGSRGGMSLRNVAVTMKGMQAAGKVAAAVEPRDAFVEDVVTRGPAMFMEVDVCMYVWSSHIAEYGSTG